MRRFTVTVTAIAVGCAAVATALLVVTDSDISATPEIHNDLIFRAQRTEAALAYRHDDPSGQLEFFPSSFFVHHAYRNFELPTWNPYAGGFSTLKRMQDAIFEPLRVVTVVVPDRQAESCSLLLSLALAFAGMVSLAVRLGRSPTAALVVAGVFAFSAHMMSTLQFAFPIVFAHLPWLALALDACVLAADVAGVVAGGAGVAVVLASLVAAGHPGNAVAVVGAAALLVAARAVALGRAKALVRVVPFCAAAALLSAPVWLPFLDELQNAWVSKYETQYGLAYAPIAWKYWPSIVGAIVVGEEPGTYGDFINAWCWLGVPATALALGGLVVAWRAKERWFVVVVVVVFAFAMPGPWMELGRRVPVLRMERIWYLYTGVPFVAALAAAFAFDALGARVPLLRRPLVAVVVGMVLATLPPARMALWAAPHDGELLPKSAALDALRAANDASMSSGAGPIRITGAPGQVHLQNVASITGIDDIRSHSATFSRRYDAWFHVVDPDVLKRSFPTTRVTPLIDHALMRSFGIGFALEPRVPGDEWHADLQAKTDDKTRVVIAHPGDADVVLDDGFVRLWRIHGARARASGARTIAIVASPEAAADALRDEAFVDTHDVVESDGPTLRDIASRPSADVVVKRFARPTVSTVSLDVDAAGPALVVVNELYDDGWRATVDGRAAEILPTNLIARGVVVSAGKHTIEMRYETPGLALGVVLFLIGMLALAVAVVVARRRAVAG